jgi:hypothetical protein
MTDSTVAAINSAFQDEGFAPDSDCRYEDSSVRRQTTQSYLDAVDWTDPRQVGRFLQVAERLLNGWEPQSLSHFHQSLRREGYRVDEQTGQITPVGPQLSIKSIARLADPSAIREGFERIRRAIADDPALAVGSAKELIESTAKVVLTERGQPFDDKYDLPKLAVQHSFRSGSSPRPDPGRTAAMASGASSARSQPSPMDSPSYATECWAPDMVRQLHALVFAAGTRTSRSTRHSPGVSSWSTPSPTPKRPGAKVTRKPR